MNTIESGQQVSVVGSGPNGLAAAIRLARFGFPVTVYERAAAIGGGLRSDAEMLPGYVLDHCASVFPLAVASPFFSTLPLAEHGCRWIQPTIALAHPLDDGTAVALHHSLDRTADELGPDGAAWRALFGPLVDAAPTLLPAILGPIRPGGDPLPLLRFGTLGALPATTLARSWFRTKQARALFAGLAAHSFLRLDRPLSSAIGLVLGMLGHVAGWPLAAGGAQAVANALAAILLDANGRIETNSDITALADLPRSATIMLDTDPVQAARIAGSRFPARFASRLLNHDLGPGSFKIDYALDGPVPWRAGACRDAGTIHLGGTLEEIAESERAVVSGTLPQSPYAIAVQPSRFDPSRAPAGKESFWVYCHIPNGSEADMTGRLETQIERFAPGFRELIIERVVTSPAAFEQFNPNFAGGAISGGPPSLITTFAQAMSVNSPYATPDPSIFLCSASTPPGGGVHGMSGFHAAGAALQDLARRSRQ
jgi:phytoene dehydrogenase-like protein